jgi:hypothetical protein
VTKSKKSTHPENLGGNPLVLRKIHSFETADKISQNPDKGMQPDGKTPVGAFATLYHKNIKVLVLGDPHTSLLDTIKSGSSSFESVSTYKVDSYKGSVDSHISDTWQVVKSKNTHH